MRNYVYIAYVIFSEQMSMGLLNTGSINQDLIDYWQWEDNDR